MEFPIDLTFRDMASSPAIEASVRRWVKKLARVHDRIARCHVVIERPHQHQHQGQSMRVGVTLSVPGSDVVISRNTGRAGVHEDLRAAIRDAFAAARRQLGERGRRGRASRTTDTIGRHEPLRA
jgi:ribosome-associated translation inhibitor RaiA